MKNSNEKGLATLYLRNPHLFALTIVVAAVAGLSALVTLPRIEDPTITNRNPLILVPFPGADASRVEALVVEPVEEELQEIPEIKHINATARAGIAVIAVELLDEIGPGENNRVFSEMRDALDSAQQRFPEGAQPPIFDDNRKPLAYSVIVGLTWDNPNTPDAGMLNRLAESLGDRLRNLPGTDLVRLYGAPAEEITVVANPGELAALGVSAAQLASATAQADSKSPAGFVRAPENSLLLEVSGEFDSLARIASVPIRTGTRGEVLRLGDIAEVQRGWRDPPATMALSNGQRSVFVAARVRPEERLDQWTAIAQERIERFRAEVGAGIAVETIFTQNVYTSERLGSLASNLFLGALVVGAVVFFTMGWRSSIIVGSAMPLTAALTLFVITMTGGALHQMSIFGMIIALGLLIDNAIVTADEVRKNLRAGASKGEAVGAAVRHLFVPLLSSTLTTILAFMPILLMPGNAGDFIGSIGGSVVIALAVSFLVAMTLIATATGHFGRPGNRQSWVSTGLHAPRLGQGFRKIIGWCLRRPAVALPLACIVPVVGFALASTLGVQFFPRTDRDTFEVHVWLPTSTAISETAATAQRMETAMRAFEDVEAVYWTIGGSFPPVYYNMLENKDGAAHFAHGVVKSTGPFSTGELAPALQRTLDERFPEAQVVVRKFAQGPPAEADVELRLLGPSLPRLQELGEAIRVKLAEHPEILHTRTSLPRGEPKLWVQAREEDVRLAGLQLADVALQLQANLEGLTGGSVLEELEEMPVRVRYGRDGRSSIAAVRGLNLVNPRQPGEFFPVEAIADVELRPQLGTITHRDQERVNILRGWVREGALPIDVTNEVVAQIEASGLDIPEGYRLELGGESENQGNAVGNLMKYLPVLLTITAATLILAFGSVRLAALLGFVAFLSVGVGLLATYLSGFPLSFNTILGSFGLVGLAFNSSIVVLAAILADEKARGGDREALVEAVMGSSRHLLSTTFTTIGGFLPLLVFVGGNFWPPLAIVLAGGVGGSTLLAMLFTPAAYRAMGGGKADAPATTPETAAQPTTA